MKQIRSTERSQLDATLKGLRFERLACNAPPDYAQLAQCRSRPGIYLRLGMQPLIKIKN